MRIPGNAGRSRASPVEAVIAVVKHQISSAVHLFENSFGPPGAGELRFEQLPRRLLTYLCQLAGPERVARYTPAKWKETAAIAASKTVGPSPLEWVPIQIANYGTWPRRVSLARLPPPPPFVLGPACRLTYLGHAGILFQTLETNVLIDPLWARCAGWRKVLGRTDLVNWGVRRVIPPAYDYNDPAQPEPNLILATHDHVDAFDKSAVRELLHFSGPTFVSGSGFGLHFRSYQAPARYHLQWYDSIQHDLLKVQFLPAVHSSGRGSSHRNGTLWGSFLVHSPVSNVTIFHAGGTGYSDHFKIIRKNVEEELGLQIDLAIFPIGNYEVGGVANIHLRPREAVQAFLDLNARRALAVQHDTFPLGIEAFGQAKRDLLTELHQAGISPREFFVLNVGEHIYLNQEDNDGLDYLTEWENRFREEAESEFDDPTTCDESTAASERRTLATSSQSATSRQSVTQSPGDERIQQRRRKQWWKPTVVASELLHKSLGFDQVEEYADFEAKQKLLRRSMTRSMYSLGNISNTDSWVDTVAWENQVKM